MTSDPGTRIRRWRVDWNGLGDEAFCPTVRRTPDVAALLATDPLAEVRAFLDEVSSEQLERVQGWAYLDETRSSYAIEGEAPPGNKAEAFAALLREANVPRMLDEPTLVALQNAVITNPLLRAASYRTDQNYLSNGVPGAAGVTFVPPPPDLLPELLGGISRLANGQTAPGLAPLVRAALVSFGFVYAHPFHDGNGRLSRFLAHYTLCQAQALPNGHILPLSTAMKRHESDYRRALQSFSRPARALWDVRWIDADDFQFEFRGHSAVYRYFDATEIAAFVYRMAQETLRQDLRGEVEFLHAYDAVTRAVNERYDIANATLSKLIVMAYQNDGVVSKHRRRQFGAAVPEEAFDFIEQALREHSSHAGRTDH